MASTSLSPLPCLTVSSSRLHSVLAFGDAGTGARARVICREKQMSGIKISHNYKSLKASSAYTTASLSLDSFFGESEDEGGEELKEKEKAKCPPGLRSYEIMLVLRPDISEEDRLALTQRYEEMIVAGGGIGVEVFNRGLIPLAYSIKKRVALTGELDTFWDGVYILFTYFGKPDKVEELERTIQRDDYVIRSTIFKVRERKL